MKIRHRRRHIGCFAFYWGGGCGKEFSRIGRNDIGRKGWGLRHDNRMAWYRKNK